MTDTTGLSLDLPEPTIPVWDRFVRLFHWALVTSIGGAAGSGFLLDASWLWLHLFCGTAAAALILARIVWGGAGPTYARFSSFVVGPRTLLAYASARRNGTAARYVGHNPAGGAMILALMATIAAIALTGAVVLGGVLKTGPLASVSYVVGAKAGALHWALALGLLALIAAHLGGVILETLQARDPLVRAMMTGRKPSRAGDVTAPARRGRGAIGFLAAAILIGATAALVLALSAAARPVAHMPVAQIDPLVARECTACHMLYHPSLLPARNWAHLTAHLDNHFGEDASLDPAGTAEIAAFLTAHAAETADTRPAHVFADAVPGASLTETAFWKARHEDIPPEVFLRRPVLGRSNCAACHADAETGRFSPFNLAIPKEPVP